MSTMTKGILELIKTKHMTAKQLIHALGLEDKPDSVHGAITNLKTRGAIVSVGKAVESQKNNRTRIVDIYGYIEPAKALKLKETVKKRLYRVDLTKAKTKDRYLSLLMKGNPQFLLYANELGIKRGHYE